MVKRIRSEIDSAGPARKRARQATPTFDELPDEILLSVLSKLSVLELTLCQRLSRKLSKLAVDSQIWKEKYYEKWVRPRALRIPGLRDSTTDSKNLLYSSKLSKWLDDDHLVRRGKETNWKRQYRLRHNWSKGNATVKELEVAQPPTPPSLLVRFHRGIIITADAVNGLRAWSRRNDGTILAEAPLEQSYHGLVKLPSALAVGSADPQDEKMSVVVGFEDGSFRVFTLCLNLRQFELHYTQPSHGADPGLGSTSATNRRMSTISSIAIKGPYLLLLSKFESLYLYRFDSTPWSSPSKTRLTPPRLITTLTALNIGDLASLSLRSSPPGLLASIVYVTWNVTQQQHLAMQELRLSPSGEILGSRLASTVNTSRTLASDVLNPTRQLAPPVSILSSRPHLVSNPSLVAPESMISYSHPYLLVTNTDNTMTFFTVVSTPDTLEIRPGYRLWGHTTGIASAQVSDRGKAVSVADHGHEVRVWELEGLNASNRGWLGERSVRISPARSDDQEREMISWLSAAIERRGSGLGLALEEASRWVGFDDEQVVVLRENRGGGQLLSCYDFS